MLSFVRYMHIQREQKRRTIRTKT